MIQAEAPDDRTDAEWAAQLSDDEATRWAAHRMSCAMAISGCALRQGDDAFQALIDIGMDRLLQPQDLKVLKLALKHFALVRNADPMSSLAAFIAKRAGVNACRQFLASQ